MDKEKFKEELDELIFLFRKFKEKAESEHYGMDKTYLAQLEMFLKSYDMAKDNISEEMVDQLGRFGPPMQDMIRQMIIQLKEELGQEAFLTDKSQKKEIRQEVKAEKKVEIGPSLEEIDRMLQLPNLPEIEIDKLLDRRKRLMQ